MKQVKVGVIGLGSISQMHLDSYEKNENATIYAVCDVNAQRASAIAEKYKVAKVYTNYVELLDDPDIDAISICTWNNTHAEISIAAMRAGKHVLVEKPLSRSNEEALSIQAAVEQYGKKLQIGYVRRFDPNVQLLLQMIDNGTFGELYYAKASNLRRYGNPGGWFSDIERSGGGPLIDIGVHAIDLCWYLMGKPKVKSVSANTYRKLGNRSNIINLSQYRAADYDAEKNSVEDLANALITFENGASIVVDVSFTLHIKQDEVSVKLFGDKGGFEVDPSLVIVTEQHNTIINSVPQVDHPSFDFKCAFQNEINHFIDCIQHDKEPLSPVSDGVEMMKILNAIYESAAKGAEVRL